MSEKATKINRYTYNLSICIALILMPVIWVSHTKFQQDILSIMDL